MSIMALEHDTEVEKVEPSVTGMTQGEMFESLTGFDEDTVLEVFGQDVTDLQGTKFVRALITIWLQRRDGIPAADAYQKSKALTFKELAGYFDEDDEISPDAPTTESGKG